MTTSQQPLTATIQLSEAATMGWASGAWPQRQYLSHIAAPDATDREPTTAVVDWWTGGPMALEPAECNRIIDTARMVDPRLSSYGSYHPLLGGLDADLWESLIARVKAANERWWRLDVDEWHVAAKRYRTGEEHAAHQDWIPGHSATKKIVAAWQLSPADYYYGGNVVVTAREHRKTVPREQGSVYILPSWTTHEVEPITVGERWSLLVNAYGPALR